VTVPARETSGSWRPEGQEVRNGGGGGGGGGAGAEADKLTLDYARYVRARFAMVGIDISSAILASLSRRATFRSAGFAVMTNAMHDTIR